MKVRPKLKSRLPHSLVRMPILTVHQEIIDPRPSTSSTAFSSLHSLCENPFSTKASKGVQVKPRTSDRTTYCAIYKKKIKKPFFEEDDEMEEVVLPSTQGSSTSVEMSSSVEVSSEILTKTVIQTQRSLSLVLSPFHRVAATNDQEAVSQPQTLATHPIDNIDEPLSLSDENSVAEVLISTTSDATETDPNNENQNQSSNLVAYWKSATGEMQLDDQPVSNPPALSDAADDAGSSDDDNIPEPPPPPQLNLHTAQMCRVCLALDVKMFDLRDTELKTMFQMTTGITFEEKEGSKLGSLICWECAARLQAASTFIRKALFSETLLKGLMKKGEQIQQQYFETVKEEADSLIPSKTLTVTEIVHIVEIEDQNSMTQLVQSGDDENDETEEIVNEIKEEMIDENSEMDFEGDKDVVLKTGIKDDPTRPYVGKQNRTKTLKENAMDRSSIEEKINYSRPLVDIGHTSLRSDLTSSQADCDDLISKTVTKTYSKILPKQNIELKNPIKRSQVALSHDHDYYLKEDSEDGNEKKRIKKI